MKRIAMVLLLAAPAAAFAAKPCEELKTEIAAKIDAAGAKGYSLEIVKADADVGAAKVVGTCGAGKSKILYSRSAAPAPAPQATPTADK